MWPVSECPSPPPYALEPCTPSSLCPALAWCEGACLNTNVGRKALAGRKEFHTPVSGLTRALAPELGLEFWSCGLDNL